MQSDLASLAKYLEVNKCRRRSRRMESYKKRTNVINLLHSRPLEEEEEEEDLVTFY